MKRKTIILLICLSLAILFSYSALSKLYDYANFRFGISESPFISPFAGILAWAVPLTELVIVLLLLWPATRTIGLYTSSVLLILFSIFIAAMLLQSSDLPCSCGGVLEQMSWPVHIVFNGFFILLGVVGTRLENRQRKLTLSANLRKPSYAKRYSPSNNPY